MHNNIRIYLLTLASAGPRWTSIAWVKCEKCDEVTWPRSLIAFYFFLQQRKVRLALCVDKNASWFALSRSHACRLSTVFIPHWIRHINNNNAIYSEISLTALMAVHGGSQQAAQVSVSRSTVFTISTGVRTQSCLTFKHVERNILRKNPCDRKSNRKMVLW